MQKLEERALKKNRKNWKARLARKRPTKKPKGVLSAGFRAKHEVAWKLSYLRPIKGVGSKGEIHHIPTHLQTETPRLRTL